MLPAMPTRFGVLSAVFRSPILRRLEIAYLIFAFGEWSTWVAVIVYAYARGGAGEAGIVGFAGLAPSGVVGPARGGVRGRVARDPGPPGTVGNQLALLARD